MSWKAKSDETAIKSLNTPKNSRRASSGLFKFKFDNSASHHNRSRSLHGHRLSLPSRGGKRWSGQGAAPLKDTRNLSNRGVQRKFVEELISFLQEHGYPHSITSKQLQAPTKKECEKLFSFLIEVLIPNQKIKKLEDDVPRLLKQLKYPFPISKSVMFSIGSSHSWPSMLGALHWLMELIKYCSNATESGIIYPHNFEDGQDQEIKQAFLDFCCKSFQATLADSDELDGDENNVLYEYLIDQAGVSDKEYEDLKQAAEAADEELRALEAEPNTLQIAEERRSMLQEECQSLERSIIEINRKSSTLRLKKATLEPELRSLGINTECNTQKPQLLAGNQQNEITIQKLTAEKERVDSLFWDKQMEYSKLYTKADESLQAYNDISRHLLLDRTILKLLAGRDITMTMDDANMTGLKRTLRELQSKLCEVVNFTEAESISEESKLEQLSEMSSEKRDRQSQLQIKLSQIEKELEFKQETMVKEQKYLSDFVAKLESENEALEHGGRSLITDKEREVTELKEEVFRTTQEYTRQEDNYEFFLRKVVEVVSDHHSALQTRWGQIGADAEQDLMKLRLIEAPHSKLLKATAKSVQA